MAKIALQTPCRRRMMGSKISFFCQPPQLVQVFLDFRASVNNGLAVFSVKEQVIA